MFYIQQYKSIWEGIITFYGVTNIHLEIWMNAFIIMLVKKLKFGFNVLIIIVIKIFKILIVLLMII
jgi:hypothetical protein